MIACIRKFYMIQIQLFTFRSYLITGVSRINFDKYFHYLRIMHVYFAGECRNLQDLNIASCRGVTVSWINKLNKYLS